MCTKTSKPLVKFGYVAHAERGMFRHPPGCPFGCRFNEGGFVWLSHEMIFTFFSS